MRPSPGRAWLAGGVLLVAGLAGCLAGRPFPGAPDAGLPTAGPGVAVQRGVEDPVPLVVKVTEETRGGAPIPNATVAFFTATNRSPEAWDFILPKELPCDERTDLVASPHWDIVAVGKTDEDGQVVGLVDSAVANWPSVAVGGVKGFTTELVPWGSRVGDWNRTCFLSTEYYSSHGTLAVPLLRRHLDVSMHGVTNLSASAAVVGGVVDLPTGLDEPVWDHRKLVLHPQDVMNAWYGRRLDRLEVELLWNNTGPEFADFYLAACWCDSVENSSIGRDRLQLPGSGTSRETLTWSADPWSTNHAPLIGPATNATVASADGLAWRIKGTATIADAPVVLPRTS